MKRFLFLLLLMVIACASAGEKPELGEMKTSAASVDIVTQNGNLLLLSFEASPGTNGNGIVATEVQLTKGSKSIIVENGQASGGEYQFILPVSDHRLSVGTWAVRGVAIDSVGRTNQTQPITLEVTGTNPPEFSILVDDQLSPYQAIEAGLGTTVQIEINTTGRQDLLGTAQWQTNGTWRAMSRFGDILAAKDFEVAEGNLEVQFHDRLNRIHSATIPFEVDSKAPSLTFSLPPKMFSVVENKVGIESDENATLVYNFNGKQFGLDLEKGLRQNISLNVNTSGVYSLVVASFDDRGNSESQTLQFAFVRPTTEVVLASAEVDRSAVLIGDAITLTAKWTQTGAAATANVEGQVLENNETLYQTSFDLEKEDSFTWSRAMLLTPGLHELTVATTVHSAFNQSNHVLERNLTVEVFLGKVVYGDTSFFIRQGPLGFPSEAVNGTTVYPLKIRADSNHPIYDFEGHEGYWDSHHRITTVTPSVEPEETKDTPFPALLGVLSLLGAVLVRRR